MAKRKKRSKVQRRGKLRKGNSAKPRRVKAAKAKRTARSAPVKKVARKQPVASAVETVAVEVIEQPAPGVIAVTEVEETRKAS
jgi:hypothetical protein